MTKPDKNGQPDVLTLAQQNAIDLLAAGLRDAEVAERTGVSRQTVNGWRNHEPAFQAALNARRADLWAGAVDRLRALLPMALEVLAERLEGARDPRFALEVLRLAAIPQASLAHPGPTTAEDVRRAEARQQQDRMLEDLLSAAGR